MKLNLDILCERLPKSYKPKRYGPSKRSLVYQRPLLFEPDHQISPDCLYIAPAAALPQIPPHGTAMICVGKAPRGWLMSGIQLLCLEGSDDMAGAMRDVCAIYDRLEQWDYDMREELEKEEFFHIENIVKIAVTGIENHIGICDHKLTSICLCDYTSDKTGSYQVETYLQPEASSPVGQEYWNIIYNVCNVERKIREPYLSDAPNLEGETYCSNVYYRDHFMGCIYVRSSHHSFREGDFALMDHCFIYLRRAVRRFISFQTLEDSMEMAALRIVLEGKKLRRETRDMLALSPDQYYLFFCLRSQKRRKVLPRDYMCENVRTIMPRNVFCSVFGDQLAGLLKLDSSDSVCSERVVIDFEEILNDMGYFSGLSNAFFDLEEAMPYFRQACYVADKITFEETGKILNYYKDYALSYMLYNCTGDLPATSIIPKGLLKLAEMDRQKGSEYVKTLDTYLCNETNTSRTAEELYVHRSSLQKRLKKIQSYLHMNLEDPDDCLMLRISLRLMEHMDE